MRYINKFKSQEELEATNASQVLCTRLTAFTINGPTVYKEGSAEYKENCHDYDGTWLFDEFEVIDGVPYKRFKKGNDVMYADRDWLKQTHIYFDHPGNGYWYVEYYIWVGATDIVAGYEELPMPYKITVECEDHPGLDGDYTLPSVATCGITYSQGPGEYGINLAFYPEEGPNMIPYSYSLIITLAKLPDAEYIEPFVGYLPKEVTGITAYNGKMYVPDGKVSHDGETWRKWVLQPGQESNQNTVETWYSPGSNIHTEDLLYIEPSTCAENISSVKEARWADGRSVEYNQDWVRVRFDYDENESAWEGTVLEVGASFTNSSKSRLYLAKENTDDGSMSYITGWECFFGGPFLIEKNYNNSFWVSTDCGNHQNTWTLSCEDGEWSIIWNSTN